MFLFSPFYISSKQMSLVSISRLDVLRPIVAAALLWLVNFYLAMNRQSATRRRLRSAFISKLKKDNGGVSVDLKQYGLVGSMSFMRNQPEIVNDPAFIRADRSFQNLIEQGIPFFVSFGLFSTLYNPGLGGYLGILYSLSRFLYFPLYNHPKLLLALCTVPGYLIIFGMTGTLFWKIML